MSAVFLYGTLRHLPLLRIVIGDEADGAVQAEVPDHAVLGAEGQDFPLIAARPGAVAQGLLLSQLSQTALERMDFYEAGFAYDRRPVQAVAGGVPCAATVFFPDAGAWHAGPPWSLEDWVETWGPVAERAASQIMARFGATTAAQIARFRPQIWSRAASWVRARSAGRPVRVRRGYDDANVETCSTERPYDKYFMLEERNVRFRRFDGGLGGPVARAAFVSGDAVTVLPYDPVRDRVMLIEQFRFGPYVRGDRCPWSLEPIAGRIDAGETPEACARREAGEEAGLALDRLEPVARYYPSPGAVTEYLFSYVGIADLTDGVAGLGGVEDESEDIRSILMSFDALMQLLTTGEAENGPLILSALWLAANRDRLRAGA
ncbi:MAG: NUDIX domain-containing protein [Rhodobacter sp.]|nr:NUDIX domain-containing protein [Rhodobacter sp.]